MRSRAALVLVLVSLASPALAQQSAREHWVGTWAAAPHDATFVLPGTQPLREIENQTIRMVVPSSLGGRRVRVRFSNTYGKTPLTLTAVHIALRKDKSSIVAGTDRALTFGRSHRSRSRPGRAR
jgi:hypothetical protein